MEYLDITGIDLTTFVQAVYDESRPQGFGLVHFTPEPLTREEAASLVNLNARQFGRGAVVVSLDYVRGRSCKMAVDRTDDGKLWIRLPWHDHDAGAMDRVLRFCGCVPHERITHADFLDRYRSAPARPR